jgi:hypothetical protein
MLDALAKAAAYVIFVVAAVYEFSRGFVEGVLEARQRRLQEDAASPGETPFPAQPRPAARPLPAATRKQQSSNSVAYTVQMDADSEVTVNGLPIGHIDAAPWQFCSYDESYGNGPARATKEQAWDDACDYAESVVRAA